MRVPTIGCRIWLLERLGHYHYMLCAWYLSSTFLLTPALCTQSRRFSSGRRSCDIDRIDANTVLDDKVARKASSDGRIVDVGNRREFYVHEILQHDQYTCLQDSKTKGNMDFLDRRLGYRPEWNSWEPWCNVRAVRVLHRY